MTITISTACAHCGQPLHMVVDQDLRSQVLEELAKPLVFQPEVDWAAFKDPNIIHRY